MPARRQDRTFGPARFRGDAVGAGGGGPGRPAPPGERPRPAPLVTVVIPTRNRLALLEEAVGSVLSQAGVALELVVVDDASTDGTAAWLALVGDARLRPITLPGHAERSVARNTGLAQAGAPYVLFLDDDDRLRPGALAVMAAALEADERVVAVVGARTEFDGAGSSARPPHVRREAELRRPWVDVVCGWFAFSGQVLMRTAAVRAAGAWSPGLSVSEDIELLLRLGARGTFRLLPHRVLEYRVHDGQEARPADVDAGNEALCRGFLATLEPGHRCLGARLLEVRRALVAADHAFCAARLAPAVRLYGEALRLWPALVGSPVLRPKVAASLRRAALGPLLPLARRARRAVAPRPGQRRRSAGAGRSVPTGGFSRSETGRTPPWGDVRAGTRPYVRSER